MNILLTLKISFTLSNTSLLKFVRLSNQDPPDYNGDGDGNAIMPLKKLAFPTEQQWNTLKNTLPRLRTDEFYTRNYTLEYSARTTKNKTFAFSPYMVDK